MQGPLVDLDAIRAARERLGDAVHRTPTIGCRSISERVGTEVVLKAELFQKTGSFKARGLLHRVLRASEAERRAGFVSVSAGNAAAALAWAASRVGSRATIVMPEGAVRSKQEATRAYGGEVVLTAGDLLEACEERRRALGAVFVHPFDDLDVIAGHAGVGVEILEQAPGTARVLVPLGGGGLVSGVAAAIKGSRPEIAVIGVEPEGAAVMTASLRSGRVERLAQMRTVADGLAAPFAGEHTLRHVRALVDEVVTVPDEAILRALKWLWTRAKLAAEPSGAAGLAALLEGRVAAPEGLSVCVVSGGNVDAAGLPGLLATR